MLMNMLMNMLAMLLNNYVDEYVGNVDENVDKVGNVDDYCCMCTYIVHIQQYSHNTYKHNPLFGHPSTSLPHMCNGTSYYRMHTVIICSLWHSHSYRQLVAKPVVTVGSKQIILHFTHIWIH